MESEEIIEIINNVISAIDVEIGYIRSMVKNNKPEETLLKELNKLEFKTREMKSILETIKYKMIEE